MFKPLVLLLFLLSVLYFPLHMKLLFVYILFCYLLTKFFNGEYISIEVIKISALLTYHELLRKKDWNCLHALFQTCSRPNCSSTCRSLPWTKYRTGAWLWSKFYYTLFFPLKSVKKKQKKKSYYPSSKF